MQAGFSMLETGTVREKNQINILYKNILDGAVAAFGFWPWLDNVCAMSFLRWVLQINFHQSWGYCHDPWAEVRHALNAAGCWSAELLLTIVYTYRCGPFGTSEHFNSMVDTVHEWCSMVRLRAKNDPVTRWLLENHLFDQTLERTSASPSSSR